MSAAVRSPSTSGAAFGTGPKQQQRSLNHTRCPAAATRALEINFSIPYRVQFGQSLSVVGSSSLLGDWDVDRRVPMQWNDGDVWCAGVQVDEDACALEYKYVIVDNNGHISSWKPGGNYEIKLERYSGAVAVRDDWNGDVHEIRLEPSAQSALPQVPPSAAASMASEDDAVLDALQRAYLELEAALQISLQLADEADDPSDPRLLLNDQKLAAASRRAVSLSKALEAGAPPPAYILKELERGSDPH